MSQSKQRAIEALVVKGSWARSYATELVSIELELEIILFHNMIKVQRILNTLNPTCIFSIYIKHDLKPI